MKKEATVKYPNSACLFQFCRKVLDHKFGGVRVIDQDVGQILGFDPADCSHWKKGKKNIRSIQAVKSIAEHLGIDEKLIVDVANGDIDETEAFFEYAGYGKLRVDEDVIEKARKEFYIKNASTWTREKEQQFKAYFNLNVAKIDSIVDEIHTKVDFSEAPLYLPEITAVYSSISLKASEDETTKVAMTKTEGRDVVVFPSHEKMRPYIRYQIAKTMAHHFFDKHGLEVPMALGDYADNVREIQSNIFAVRLLAPESQIRKELANVNIAKDLVTQLAEIFWVSKSLMNHRLKEILEK